jgi:hypothetical protein
MKNEEILKKPRIYLRGEKPI